MRGAVHRLQILTRNSTTPDAEGRAGATTTATTTVIGRLMEWTSKEDTPAAVGRFAAAIDAVAALPHRDVNGQPYTIQAKDQISATGVSDNLDGLYEVEYVLDAIVHREAYIRRRPA